jgi:hypothetical protein
MASPREQRKTFSFVIKLWKQDLTRFGLRGRITHVAESGKDEVRDFTRLHEITSFILSILEHQSSQTRVRSSFWKRWSPFKQRR